MHRADSIASSALLRFQAYEKQVESLRQQHIPDSTDSEFPRLSFLQQIVKVTATLGRDNQAYALWECVLDFIQVQMRPHLDQLALLREGLDRLTDKIHVTPLSLYAQF